MNKQGRGQLALGVILILLGAWFVAQRTVPQIAEFTALFSSWPFTLIGIGGILLLLGLIFGTPGLAVPAALVAGIGGIILYQKATGEASTWSYMWTLIPGFVGVGVFLQGLLGENTRENLKSGLNLVTISAVLFVVFGTFFGKLTLLGSYGPALLLIGLGVYLLVRGFVRGINKRSSE